MIQGDEPFHAGGESIGQTVLDFWRWAGADLLGNVWRGVLAEFLIARAPGRDARATPRVGALRLAHPVRRHRRGEERFLPAVVATESPVEHHLRYRPAEAGMELGHQRDADTCGAATTGGRLCLLPAGARGLGQGRHGPAGHRPVAFYVAARALLDRQHPRQRTIGINPLRTMMRRTAGHEAAEVRYRGLAEAIEAAGQKAAGFSG